MPFKYSWFLLLFVFIGLNACENHDEPVPIPEKGMYFPPINSNIWETVNAEELGWNTDSLAALNNFLIQENTKAFMVLVNGRIVLEQYYNGHNESLTWQWNSAGKTLTTATVGLAEQQNLLSLNTPVSSYLGSGWTSMPSNKEQLIDVFHLLTMTSGISDSSNLVIKPNLTYLADAGSRWAYGNVFQKLIDIVTEVSNSTFQNYFETELANQIGMSGFWDFGVVFKIFHSNARSMARFGLLALNGGKWEDIQILNTEYFTESVTTSQAINPAYGYMWWLNGKPNYMLPGGQTVYQGQIVPNAPADMYAAMGYADQRLYIIPSKNMVVVRMGEASTLAGNNFALSAFDNQFWQKLNAVIE